jgi:hypothetical protein
MLEEIGLSIPRNQLLEESPSLTHDPYDLYDQYDLFDLFDLCDQSTSRHPTSSIFAAQK